MAETVSSSGELPAGSLTSTTSECAGSGVTGLVSYATFGTTALVVDVTATFCGDVIVTTKSSGKLGTSTIFSDIGKTDVLHHD